MNRQALFFQRVVVSLSLMFFVACGFVACSNDEGENFARNSSPLADRYVFSSETIIPEGVAFDVVEQAFYAGSLEQVTVVQNEEG